MRKDKQLVPVIVEQTTAGGHVVQFPDERLYNLQFSSALNPQMVYYSIVFNWFVLKAIGSILSLFFEVK